MILFYSRGRQEPAAGDCAKQPEERSLQPHIPRRREPAAGAGGAGSGPARVRPLPLRLLKAGCAVVAMAHRK